MYKKTLTVILALTMVFVLCVTLSGCGDAPSESNTSSDETETTEASSNETKTYGVGETWEVDGQWKMTIDSIETTEERNEFEESDPAQVVVVKYHYENIGYEDSDGFMDGLYLALDSGQIVDAEGNMCSEYPLGSLEDYPQETPVGASCEAAAAFGLKAAGNEITINMSEYDGNSVEQKATFKLSY